MLPFFSRTLTRREMALGCALLSLALLLSALPAALCWEQAQLDTGENTDGVSCLGKRNRTWKRYES